MSGLTNKAVWLTEAFVRLGMSGNSWDFYQGENIFCKGAGTLLQLFGMDKQRAVVLVGNEGHGVSELGQCFSNWNMC